MAAKKRNQNNNNNKNESTSTSNGRKRGRDDDGSKQAKSVNKALSLSSSSTGQQQLTFGGVIVLIIAIVAGVLLNKYQQQDSTWMTNVDPTLRSFWPVVCNNNNNGQDDVTAVCDSTSIRPTRRTLETSRPIVAGQTLVNIPRSIQIWDVDALRSDVMMMKLGDTTDDNDGTSLLDAKHSMSQNPLATGAYLAAYLAWDYKRLVPSLPPLSNLTTNVTDSTPSSESLKTVDDESTIDDEATKLRREYYKALPTVDELSDHHPVLMKRHDLKTILGHHSWTFAVVMMMQEMVISEYQAFVNVSSDFGSTISQQEYKVARIHVLSRSFNPGPEACQQEVSKTELDHWSSKLLDTNSTDQKNLFEHGCHAMVPILDSLNHHPQPNVVYRYDQSKKSFVISAKVAIPEGGWELIDSYGKFSDAHLFARYGFVNSDGSGHTQASIAVFHRPLDVGLGSNEFTLVPDATKHLDDLTIVPDFQKRDLKRYLQYDDGYHDCVQKKHNPDAYELKQWKWKHLARIANDPDRWVVTLHPRSPDSKPKQSSDILITEVPPKIDPRSNLRMDMTSLVETCRLLALTTEDYNGNAIQVLKDNVANATFTVSQGSQALEYRALMFLGRLASTALMQYQTSVQAEYDRAMEFNQNYVSSSRNWTAAHLRLGEMQSLQALSGMSFGQARRWEDQAKNDQTGTFKIREKSCPSSYTDEMDEDEEKKQ